MGKGFFAVVILLIVFLTLLAASIEMEKKQAVSALENFAHKMYIAQGGCDDGE